MKLKKKIKEVIFRNSFDIMGNKIKNDGLKLEWWSGEKNLGDTLSPIVFNWMLSQKTNLNKRNRRIHFMGIGSLIGAARFDSVIWGSGIMNAYNTSNMIKHRKYVRYDIRAVRGPITRNFLLQGGYNCPEIFGDPAIIMPLIYMPKNIEKKYKTTIIYHHETSNQDFEKDINYLSVFTDDYKSFIDTIVASELVISSSLHGIILAETYGVPAVFLNYGVNEQILKYMDWYYSTNRNNVRMAASVEEAMRMKPMDIPELEGMRKKLLEAFPYDLWD
ncbi:polysaccharide pyruvyl transferase family protein [Clostridium sp. SM-530-WT-3G]|uniref:polysaccharide pyruvyl transferase family protein n=1 Tax=Clostridium sp. SM-530-WT-3G TaxID=2725303 RepID=UPI00145E2AC8|nr:polysaccharide pyruvyl transferase family protein [Clostridium sp. SM-530-WT-3G]NME83744.1 polysaccharide pyruvyl transferase family protein [Clostridium sp. SM-530-WT-3G]